MGRVGCDFSFSGLKTAVAQHVAAHPAGALPRSVAADIAASFQAAVVDVMADRAAHAMAMFSDLHPDGRQLLVVAGGVAANAALRASLQAAAAAQEFAFAAPPLRLCTDNAVRVAWTAIERLRLGLASGMDFAPRPRWPLAELGAGLAA
jgi:N6-L-threonylcarbamoyladenine synthase